MPPFCAAAGFWCPLEEARRSGRSGVEVAWAATRQRCAGRYLGLIAQTDLGVPFPQAGIRPGGTSSSVSCTSGRTATSTSWPTTAVGDIARPEMYRAG